MQRLRSSGTSILGSFSAPNVKRKAQNSWAAVQDTYFSTKDTFERHRVVFTVGTSVASVATAWIGYTLRHLRDSKVDQRLESIERIMKNNYDLEHKEIQRIVGSGGLSVPACVATAGTTLFIGRYSSLMLRFMELTSQDMTMEFSMYHVSCLGSSVAGCVASPVRYGLGWRSGSWYANRKFRKEQMKMLGLIKPKKWQLLGKIQPRAWQFIRRPLKRSKVQETAVETPNKSSVWPNESHQSC
ncbi:uncharacterized protein LOC129295579 isoform X1 [Prosopis cineraria]|uniref:uncharacterized protein LOC129295579 isoform X1 n=1 Tax=Prosopis cineraria TaxID=364024 RepID=UPI00240EC21C|nr:uncharacterized protein LOC129295579 isoform X1 [Prosopis cineraria]